MHALQTYRYRGNEYVYNTTARPSNLSLLHTHSTFNTCARDVVNGMMDIHLEPIGRIIAKIPAFNFEKPRYTRILSDAD
jgi:hypothetical protein